MHTGPVCPKICIPVTMPASSTTTAGQNVAFAILFIFSRSSHILLTRDVMLYQFNHAVFARVGDVYECQQAVAVKLRESNPCRNLRWFGVIDWEIKVYCKAKRVIIAVTA
jgi:hypothetical protein